MSERLSGEERAREARKFGTVTPHEPTDEFVVRAFAEGASRLWPDSRDPGWHVTFQRWLDRHVAARLADQAARLAAVEALADEWDKKLRRQFRLIEDDPEWTDWHSRELRAVLRAVLRVDPSGTEESYRPCAGCDSVGDSCRAVGCPAVTTSNPA